MGGGGELGMVVPFIEDFCTSRSGLIMGTRNITFRRSHFCEIMVGLVRKLSRRLKAVVTHHLESAFVGWLFIHSNRSRSYTILFG